MAVCKHVCGIEVKCKTLKDTTSVVQGLSAPMPLPSSGVGRSLPVHKSYIDARWLMSYAAGVGKGDNLPCYMDSTRGGVAEYRSTSDFHSGGMQGAGIVAHPVFIWAVEWPIFWRGMGPLYSPGPGETGLLREEGLRSVHYSEDILIHRPIVAGDNLDTIVSVVSVETKAKGSVGVVRCDTVDAQGEPVGTTWSGSYYRGVSVEGNSLVSHHQMPPAVPSPSDKATKLETIIELPVSAVEAHVYSECARIWNPIHTDRAAAIAAGLPNIILHGTAILARAVSALVAGFAAADPTRVERVVVGAFSAPVFMPSTMKLKVLASDSGGIWFEVLNGDGQQAIRDGFIGLRPLSAAL